MKKCKLFCLPYAGGSASIYTRWRRFLNERIELYPLELAGRGRRLGDPFYNSMSDMIEDLYQRMEGELDGSDFALFGHSMGAHVAYELAYRIKQRGGQHPVHLFVSGTCPPHAKNSKILHTLSDEEFQTEIKRLGGTPEEVFQSEELMRLIMPVLRKDFQLFETHVIEEERAPLDCDISVLYATDDIDTKKSDVLEWCRYGRQKCSAYEFSGGHFFINVHPSKVVSIINDTLFVPTF